MAITRRVFLKGGALAVVGTSVIPSFLTRAVYAAETATAGTDKKRLVVLFQRGAAVCLLLHAAKHCYSAPARH